MSWNGEQVVYEVGLGSRAFHGDAEKMFATGKIEQKQRLIVGLDVILKCLAESALVVVGAKGHERRRERNSGVKLRRKIGAGAVYPRQRNAQGAGDGGVSARRCDVGGVGVGKVGTAMLTSKRKTAVPKGRAGAASNPALRVSRRGGRTRR